MPVHTHIHIIKNAILKKKGQRAKCSGILSLARYHPVPRLALNSDTSALHSAGIIGVNNRMAILGFSLAVQRAKCSRILSLPRYPPSLPIVLCSPRGPPQTLIYIFHLHPRLGCGSFPMNQKSKQGRFREGEAEQTQVWNRAPGGVQSPAACQVV